MIPTTETIGRVTATEPCLGVIFLRGAVPPFAVRALEASFEMPAAHADPQASVSRTTKLGRLVAHPATRRGYLPAEARKCVVERAFKGSARFIDAGENHGDVGVMVQRARTRYDRRTD